MNDRAGLVERPLRNENAVKGARSSPCECRTDPTLTDLVATAQRDWWRFRDAQLHVLAAGAPLLHFAEAHEKVFREYCGCVLGNISSPRMVIDPARASLEALAFALQVWKDPDARSLTRAQRAEYASGLGWFAHLCPETDPDKAIALARSLGRLAGIAALYRQQKDEADPSRQRRLAKARTTRGGRTTGHDGTTPSPGDSATLPIDDARVSPYQLGRSVKAETVSALATPDGEAPTATSLHAANKEAAGEPKARANPTEEVELPLAATTATRLARIALCNPELSRLLVDHLRILQGIRPAVNLAPLVSDQTVLGWLQVNGMFFGPVRNASICATIAGQVVIERSHH